MGVVPTFYSHCVLWNRILLTFTMHFEHIFMPPISKTHLIDNFIMFKIRLTRSYKIRLNIIDLLISFDMTKLWNVSSKNKVYGRQGAR